MPGFLSVSVTEGLFFAYKENEPKQDDGRAPDIEFEFLSINHFSPDVKDAFEYNFAKDVSRHTHYHKMSTTNKNGPVRKLHPEDVKCLPKCISSNFVSTVITPHTYK